MRVISVLLGLVVLAAPGRHLEAHAPRIVAVGDIHGSLDGFSRILRASGLADDTGRWAGGTAQFVQTGDATDRGQGTRAVLDLLIRLERQADEAGGRVVVLLGNHEVMNLVREVRDVTPEIFATFADRDSEQRREDAWRTYAALGEQKRQNGQPVPPVYAQSKHAWMATHPLGFVEYMAALSPRGTYGAWLRQKSMVAELGGSIFMHAGIPPATAPASLHLLNTQLREEINRFDQFVDALVAAELAAPFFTLGEILQVASSEVGLASALAAAAQQSGRTPEPGRLNQALRGEAAEILKIGSWLAIAGDQALWYRGFATAPDDPSGGPIAALLKRYSARRFVTGHSPQSSRSISTRFGGRVVLIDTGMLTAVYKGRPAALEINGDILTAIYEDGRVTIE